MSVGVQEVKKVVAGMCDIIIENEKPFCELDSAAGDGDFGMSLAKGFREVKKQLEEILPAELLYRPVKDFSGGMKRRTAICRAVFASPDILIMDEPFTGLDEETKAKVMSYILRHKREDAILLFTTHQEEDGRGLNARKIWIGK